jgi:hypothetical protein
MKLNQMNSAPLDTGQATEYGCATMEPQDTSRVAGPLDFGRGYRLDAKGRQEAEDDRLDLLERLFDPLSRRRRQMVQPGWRCLEVGAGRGSMAVWLAERVGDNGHVVATDIDVTYLKRLNVPNLEVRQHNILEDPLLRARSGLVRSGLLTFNPVLARRQAGGGYPAHGGVFATRRMAGG